MLLDSSAHGDLLANLCASRAGELKLGGIVLDGNDLGAGGGGTNVDHEHLVLCELGNLGLLAVGGLHTQQSPEQEVVDLDLGVDLGKLALETKDETNKTIGTAKRGVDAGTNTDETTGNSEFEAVVLGEQGDDAGEDGLALDRALVVLADDTGANLNLVAKFQDTSKDRTTSNTTLELLDLGTGLVDIERTDDNHVRVVLEVAHGNGNLGDERLVDGIDVELELGGDGDDGRVVGDGAADELLDRVVVCRGGLLAHKVDLVLENDDVLELHDLNGCKMLGGLRLRAGFVAGNKEKGGVHDGGTRQHSAHQNIVTGAIDETALR